MAANTLLSPDAQHTRTYVARKVGAAAAIALGIGLFMTVAAIDVPHQATDAELLRWWQDGANRTSGVVSGFAAILVAVSYPVLANYLSQLSATSRAPQWRAFARSMVAAVTAVWLVTGALRASVGHIVDGVDEPLPGIDSLRLITTINYTLLGLSGMAVLALSMLATSVVVLRTGALQRWVGYVGLGCSLVMLVAVVVQYGAYTTPLGILWAFSLAVAIWRQHDVDETVTKRAL